MASPLRLLGALILGLTVPSAAPTNVTLLAVLPERNLRYLDAWPRVGPALDLALEALKPELRPAGLSVRTVFASSTDDNGTCSSDLVRQKAAELMVSPEAPDVLLGLGCDRAERTARVFASVWQRPLLSAGDHPGLSGPLTTVYAGPAGMGLAPFAKLLAWRFHWTSRSVFAFSRQPHDFHHYFEGFRRIFGNIAPSSLDDQPDEALQFLRARGRVAYVQGSPETLQEMMRLAQAQNMTNGDYVFIYLDLLGEILEADGHREAAKPWQSKEGRDAGGLREAFQTVLIITAHKPQTPEYRRFQSELILRAQRDFGVGLNDSRHRNLVAGWFHDVLLLYIRALNETLREGGTKRDTESILGKMRNLTIPGVTGTVSLNGDNEREMDFDLWSMADVESGRYQVVARYVGSEVKIKWLEPILWKTGCPPLNNPPCVFDRNDTDYASVDRNGLSIDEGCIMFHVIVEGFSCIRFFAQPYGTGCPPSTSVVGRSLSFPFCTDAKVP